MAVDTLILELGAEELPPTALDTLSDAFAEAASKALRSELTGWRVMHARQAEIRHWPQAHDGARLRSEPPADWSTSRLQRCSQEVVLQQPLVGKRCDNV